MTIAELQTRLTEAEDALTPLAAAARATREAYLRSRSIKRATALAAARDAFEDHLETIRRLRAQLDRAERTEAREARAAARAAAAAHAAYLQPSLF